MAFEFNLFEAWPSRAYVCCHAAGRRHRRGKETTRVGHTAHPPPTPPVCWTRTAPVHFHNREPPPPGSPSNGFLRCHRQPIPSLLHAIEAPLRRRRQGQRRHPSPAGTINRACYKIYKITTHRLKNGRAHRSTAYSQSARFVTC